MTWKRDAVIGLKGTTTVGVIFRDGVVIAADKRASAGTFIASKKAQKIYAIADRIVFTTSGLVADAQILVRWIQNHVRRLTIERERPPLVKEVANLTAILLHNYFRSLLPFQVHFIIAGLDTFGPHIFFLDHSGAVQEDKFMATGSGSPIAFGVLEAYYKESMAEEEAIRLVLRALRSAIRRDTATGDGIDLAVVTKEGIKFFKPSEIDAYLKDLDKVLAEG
ncbi:MAG: proteasome subunit beta [Candidatus Njordarchaeales archaeon]